MNNTANTTPTFTAELQNPNEVWILENGMYADHLERQVKKNTNKMMWRTTDYYKNLSKMFEKLSRTGKTESELVSDSVLFPFSFSFYTRSR